MAATCKRDCTTNGDGCERSHEPTNADPVLYVALELANSNWKLAFTVAVAQQPRVRSIRARDLSALEGEIAKAKKRFRLPSNVRVASCYEAGRDGFWLHRLLQSRGVESYIVDSASIEVNRRLRRPKSDRLDATKLAAMLCRFIGGEKKVWSVVHVPSDSDEDARQLHRELEQLKDERTSHINRIKGLLATQGLCVAVSDDFLEDLPKLRRWDGTEIPRDLRARLVREFERLWFVKQQILDIEKERKRRVRDDSEPHVGMIRSLLKLRGIGLNGSWLLSHEFFSWRDIRNRRQLGSLGGLTPTPFTSGGTGKEQGISKAGNRHVRKMMTELAWCWLQYQPKSDLSRWYLRRFGMGNSRQRKIGIIALARKLLVALWKYVKHGEIPAGAETVPWQSKVGVAVPKLAATG